MFWFGSVITYLLRLLFSALHFTALLCFPDLVCSVLICLVLLYSTLLCSAQFSSTLFCSPLLRLPKLFPSALYLLSVQLLVSVLFIFCHWVALFHTAPCRCLLCLAPLWSPRCSCLLYSILLCSVVLYSALLCSVLLCSVVLCSVVLCYKRLHTYELVTQENRVPQTTLRDE